MKNKIIFSFLLIGFFIFSISMISATYSWRTYDDFSSGSLDITKWNEYNGFQVPIFTDEHFVNITEEVYHIQQFITMDTETNLEPTRQFFSGDIFSYQVLYKGGSGNHFSQPLINGNYPPTQVEPCVAPGGCGPIGYMNGVPDLEAQIGTYNITYEFSSNQVKMNSTRPDGVSIINTFTGNSEPFTFAINTHTGNNGLMYFDYDNFNIYRLNSVPNLTLIPDQTWDEDTSLTINLTNYSSDLDGDNINWSYSALINIVVTIDNSTGIATLIPNTDWFGTESVVFTATDGIDSIDSNSITLVVNDIAEPSPPSSGGGGGGGSSTTYYKCTTWGNWLACTNGNQNRTCETKQIATSLTKTALFETKTCTASVLTPTTGSATEESEENNTNEEEQRTASGFGAKITGGITGIAKTKGGKLFLIVLGVLALSWIALGVRRKFKK